MHLEVTGGQDTSMVLNAISRFTDVRGVPRKILSDNQTSFRKADKDLQKWLEQIDFSQIEEKTQPGYKGSQNGIKWIFNPPVAPHFGGIFETIVKAAKRALKDSMKAGELNEEEFRTSVSSAMNLLNTRPISTVGDDADMVPLTPNNFLIGNLGGSVFPPQCEDPSNLRERWRFVVGVVNHFWRRFNKEMIQTLQPRKILSEEHKNLTVDDIVLEIDPNTPRGTWRMLRVSRIIPSEDGLVRRVQVTSFSGKVYERSISRLIPIVTN